MSDSFFEFLEVSSLPPFLLKRERRKKTPLLTPLATAAQTALELSTTSCAVTLGLALRNAASSLGITYVPTVCDAPSLTDPASAAPRSASALAASLAAASVRSQCGSSAAPASVRLVGPPRLPGFSKAPQARPASSAAIAFETAGCETPSVRAAATPDPVRATACSAASCASVNGSSQSEERERGGAGAAAAASRVAASASAGEDECSPAEGAFPLTIPGTLLAGPEGVGHPALPRGAEPGPPSSDKGGDLPAR